jgi:hypothetical protein
VNLQQHRAGASEGGAAQQGSPPVR